MATKHKNYPANLQFFHNILSSASNSICYQVLKLEGAVPLVIEETQKERSSKDCVDGECHRRKISSQTAQKRGVVPQNCAMRVPTAVVFDTTYQNSKISEMQKAITPDRKGLRGHLQ